MCVFATVVFVGASEAKSCFETDEQTEKVAMSLLGLAGESYNEGEKCNLIPGSNIFLFCSQSSKFESNLGNNFTLHDTLGRLAGDKIHCFDKCESGHTSRRNLDVLI